MGLLQSRQTPAPAAAPAPTPITRPFRISTTIPNSASSILSYFSPITTPDIAHEHLSPTLSDIQLVSCYLSTTGLPLEIVVKILDYANYWSGCRTHSKKPVIVHSTDARGGPRRGNDDWSTGQEDEFDNAAFEESESGGGGGLKNDRGKVWYLSSAPIGCFASDSAEDILPKDTKEKENEKSRSELENSRGPRVWARQVIIETCSRDQGWSSDAAHYGTYEQSYSWFEISLLRGNKQVPNSRHSIQNNVHAGQYFISHTNIIGPSHPTIALSEPGDRIILWVRAQYPGWSNRLRDAAITTFVAPFPPQI